MFLWSTKYNSIFLPYNLPFFLPLTYSGYGKCQKVLLTKLTKGTAFFGAHHKKPISPLLVLANVCPNGMRPILKKDLLPVNILPALALGKGTHFDLYKPKTMVNKEI